MTAYDLAVLLREWGATLPLIAWLDTYRRAHPDATAADAIAALPTDSDGQDWYWWLDKVIHDRLPLLARTAYYGIEIAAYLVYLRATDEAAYDRDRRRDALIAYRAHMTPVLVACMAYLTAESPHSVITLTTSVDANSSANVRAICRAFDAERAKLPRESEVWP